MKLYTKYSVNLKNTVTGVLDELTCFDTTLEAEQHKDYLTELGYNTYNIEISEVKSPLEFIESDLSKLSVEQLEYNKEKLTLFKDRLKFKYNSNMTDSVFKNTVTNLRVINTELKRRERRTRKCIQ